MLTGTVSSVYALVLMRTGTVRAMRTWLRGQALQVR